MAASGIPDLSPRVLICTVDSFIANNILLPHADRAMASPRRPFLVQGHEPFLAGFKIFNGKHNVGINTLRIQVGGSRLEYYSKLGYTPAITLDAAQAVAAIKKLGESGAYTYEIGRYWAIATVARDRRLLSILAKRYPYILVDEAQDIGSMHGALLRLLQEAGSVISLVGDPNQSIYEFADADGSFLRDYEPPAGGLKLPLTQNRRSVPSIVRLSNLIAKSESKPYRSNPDRTHGAFYVVYEEGSHANLMTAFAAILEAGGFQRTEAAVLARSNPLADALRGGTEELGQGAAEHFAKAAVSRDRLGDIGGAFAYALDGLLRVLDAPPSTLRQDVLGGTREGVARELRVLLWRFLRDPETGIPISSLNGKRAWLPRLKKALPVLLDAVEKKCGVKRLSTWTNNVTAAKLSDAPLWQEDLAGDGSVGIRVSTVHQAKGESIAAVMYVMKSKDLKSLVAGPNSEVGRIGYVAMTRAQDLLLLAIPKGSENERKALESFGVKPWGEG